MGILPCPHCGSALDTNGDSYSRLGRFYLSCESAKCGYSGPIRKTIEEAIEAANTRANDPHRTNIFEYIRGLARRYNGTGK